MALPKLPRAFYRRSVLGGISFIVFTLLLWWLPSMTAYAMLTADMDWPLTLRVVLAVPLWFLAGQGIQLLGFVGHEGFHFNLFPSRVASTFAGIVISSMTVVFLEAGVAIDHHNHHRHTNRVLDPDLELFGVHRTFWRRLLLARVQANRVFMRLTLRLIANEPLGMDERDLPFSRTIYRRFAVLNFACATSWLTVYCAFAWSNGIACVCTLVVPLLCATLYSGIRPYLEHTDTDDSEASCARSRTHWLLTLFYFGNNLHLEHHLYPGVPCYRLAKVHRWLVQEGHLPATHPGYDPSLFGCYRYARTRFVYGKRDTTEPSDPRRMYASAN